MSYHMIGTKNCCVSFIWKCLRMCNEEEEYLDAIIFNFFFFLMNSKITKLGLWFVIKWLGVLGIMLAPKMGFKKL
jgi:hypothetical protein